MRLRTNCFLQQRRKNKKIFTRSVRIICCVKFFHTSKRSSEFVGVDKSSGKGLGSFPSIAVTINDY
jgi:hypothetical protein